LLTTRENGASLEKKSEPLAVKERNAVERRILTHIAEKILKVNL